MFVGRMSRCRARRIGRRSASGSARQVAQDVAVHVALLAGLLHVACGITCWALAVKCGEVYKMHLLVAGIYKI